jgi:transketolase
VGNDGDMIGIDHFGASAPINVLYEKFGITADRVVGKVLALIG